MEQIFLKLINLSFSAGWLILAILFIRLLFRRAPRWIFCVLWGIVALRLVCPISIESVLSLIPSAEVVDPKIMMDATPEIETGIDLLNGSINPIIAELYTPNPLASANPLQILIPIWALFWVIGAVILLLYALVSYLCLRHRVSAATRLRDNIKQSECVDSPFVLGLFCPTVYLPYRLEPSDMEFVIAHEQAHIRRGDHLWKPLGFLILSVYWFHPLLWVAYVLLCRDIEAACDEKVIREMETDDRRAYSTALLHCSVHRRRIAACPLAFGEVGVKARIKNVMHYKKPAFWVILAAVLLCVVTAICFLTNPRQTPGEENDLPTYYLIIGEENVKRIEVSTENTSGGIENADGTPFAKGERVWLDMLDGCTDLTRVAIIAYNTYGEAVYSLHRELTAPDADNQWLLVCKSPDAETTAPDADPSPQILHGSKQLTLDDVLRLSEKGEALIWEDFAEFTHKDVGSGLYIASFEIDETFYLRIGDGKTTGKPMYIRLCVRNSEDYADVFTDDIAAFVAEYRPFLPVGITTTQDVPQAVLDTASALVAEHIKTYNGYGASQAAVTGTTYTITEAWIDSIARVDTGTAGLTDACFLYRIECRLKPSEDKKENIFLAGGMRLEDGWFIITDLYFVMYCDWSSGTEVWTPLGVVSELTIATEYATDEMLSVYGNPYTAAVMEMRKAYLASREEELLLFEQPFTQFADAAWAEASKAAEEASVSLDRDSMTVHHDGTGNRVEFRFYRQDDRNTFAEVILERQEDGTFAPDPALTSVICGVPLQNAEE